MASETLTYAQVGGPPDDWHLLEIVDLDTGQKVDRVIEVNSAEGWLNRPKLDECGLIYTDPAKPGEIALERIDGRFEIRRPNC